jgi:protein-tyrosine phosphatase
MIGVIKQCIPGRVKRSVKRFARNVIDSARYYSVSGRFFCGGTPPAFGQKAVNIIFVCKGNICRSAFAEARLRQLLGAVETIRIDSCGIDVDQGNFPPPDSVSVAEEFSCSLAGRRSKGLAACGIAEADLIFPMEYGQYKQLIHRYPEKKEQIILLRSVAPFPQCLFCNIPDPYGLGAAEFRRVYSLIDQTMRRIGQWW